MSMLAEPRSRQKWSDDPRNTRWANDKSKFGYQLMTKMGWSEGKGLGQKESGNTSHIKIKKKNSNAGIGSKRSHDDDWIAHQNDFNDLLTSLNQGSNTGSGKELKSLEDRVKLSKKKILYTKFVKSKDLSNASSQDLACIFGQRSKSAPATPQISDDDGNESDISAASCPVTDDNTNIEHGYTTIRTGLSVTDYFTQKMAALAKARTSNNTKKLMAEVNGSVEENESEETEKIKSKKEKKIKDVVKSESESDVEVISGKTIEQSAIKIDSDSENDTNVVIHKKKKKRNIKTENESESISCNGCNDIEFVSKKKKNEILMNEKNKDSDCSDNSKKKRKKKKRKVEEEEDNDEIVIRKRSKYSEETDTSTAKEKSGKKKKKTEETIEEEIERVINESENNTKKKKKKKSKK